MTKIENSVFSSPELLGAQGELIVYPCSDACRRCGRQQCSNIFFSETAWIIKSQISCGASLGRGEKKESSNIFVKYVFYFTREVKKYVYSIRGFATHKI